jgi:peptidoglycan/xylan/chitin deacetylase (PgdA/CDA1 family)
VSWRSDHAAIAVLSFDVDAESPILAIDRKYAEHAMVMSHQAYGPRVGVPRILELLADLGVPGTFFVPGLTAERYPETVEAILAAGHEVGHHSHAHVSPTALTADQERADFERALAALQKVGVQPRGHRAALWEASYRTPALVAEYGLEYDSSLMGSDRPYRLRTDSGTIVELPVHWSLDDWEQYAFLPQPAIGNRVEPPSKVIDMWTAELDAMRRHHCLFLLTCHPFLSGRPSRIEGLRRLIERGLEFGDVEFCSAGEVARRAAQDATLDEQELVPVVVDPSIYPD